MGSIFRLSRSYWKVLLAVYLKGEIKWIGILAWKNHNFSFFWYVSVYLFLSNRKAIRMNWFFRVYSYHSDVLLLTVQV